MIMPMAFLMLPTAQEKNCLLHEVFDVRTEHLVVTFNALDEYLTYKVLIL